MIATDPLSLVFIFCFLLGFGFFLMASLMGGHGHGSGHAGHFHVHMPGLHHGPVVHSVGHAVSTHAPAHAPTGSGQTGGTPDQSQAAQQNAFSLASFANPTSIALFLLGFGFLGYCFHNLTPVTTLLSLLLASLGGLILAALLLTTLGRMISQVNSSTELDVADRTGMLGKISMTIPEEGLGEIIYTSPGGMRKSIPARSLNGQRLDRNLEVVVVNYQEGVAEVDTWEHFMHGETRPASSTGSGETSANSMLHLPTIEIEMLMQQEQRHPE